MGAQGGTCQVNFEGDPGDGWASIPLPAKSDYDWTEVTGTVTVPRPKEMHNGNVEIYVFIYMRTYGEALDRRRDAYPDCGITRRRRVGWDTLAQARAAPLDIHRSGRVSCGRR